MATERALQVLVNLAVVLMEWGVAGAIVWQARSLTRKLPSAAVFLAVFFLLDGLVALHRTELGWQITESRLRGSLLDAVGAVVLLLVLVNAGALARAAVATVDQAAYRAAEYERARRDYEQVVRHRLFNPLTVMKGAAETLQAGVVTEEPQRQQLLAAMIEAAREIENVTLEPSRRDALEADLGAVPRL